MDYERPVIDKGELERYLVRLMELAEETDPRLGEISRAGKNDKAREAQFLLSLLNSSLGDWAMHHLAGKVMVDSRRSHGILFDQIETSDLHIYERLSGLIDESSVQERRQVAASILLNTFSGISPINSLLAHDLGQALLALDFGETRPLLQPLKKRNRGAAFTLWRMRLVALEHLEFLRGFGLKKREALYQVAEAFGCSTATIETWEKRIKKRLGELIVTDRLSSARENGEIDNPRKLSRKRPQTLAELGSYKTFTKERLVDDGKSYQNLNRLNSNWSAR